MSPSHPGGSDGTASARMPSGPAQTAARHTTVNAEAAVFIVMIATECAPAAQAGGLGEVIFGLSRELELRGHTVEIIIPKYDCMHYDQISGLTVTHEDLWVPCGSGGFTAGGASSLIRTHRTTSSTGGTCMARPTM